MKLDTFLNRHETLLQRSREAYEMMNTEQRSIYDRIYKSFDKGDRYFLDGKAGRGKTCLENAICNRIRSEGRIACITGSTALNVTLYERGRTAHSMFGIPVQENSSDLVSRISIVTGTNLFQFFYYRAWFWWPMLFGLICTSLTVSSAI
jgi:hypothetical protein